MVVSAEKFLPLATGEDPKTGNPTFHPDDPRSIAASMAATASASNNSHSSNFVNNNNYANSQQYNSVVVDGSVVSELPSVASKSVPFGGAGAVGTGGGGGYSNVTGNNSAAMNPPFADTNTGLMASLDGSIGGAQQQPHLVCGSCCDCRRACLVINGISISFRLLAMVFLAIIGGYIEKNTEAIEEDMIDDTVRSQFDTIMKEGGIPLLETAFDFVSIIGIGLYGCGIYGAIYFKQWGIIVAGSAYAFDFVVALFSTDLFNVLLSLFFLYPHYIMYKEMKEGIMTEYNYHKIAYCCGNNRM